MVWFKNSFAYDAEDLKYRYTCKESDNLKGWGWHEHNGNNYGQQLLPDGNNGVVMPLVHDVALLLLTNLLYANYICIFRI